MGSVLAGRPSGTVSHSTSRPPALLDRGLDLVVASAFVRLSGLFPRARLFYSQRPETEVSMKDHHQGRELAVERFHSAGQRRNRQARQDEDGRGSPRELAAYTRLQPGVGQFAAREASLARLNSGYAPQ